MTNTLNEKLLTILIALLLTGLYINDRVINMECIITLDQQFASHIPDAPQKWTTNEKQTSNMDREMFESKCCSWKAMECPS